MLKNYIDIDSDVEVHVLDIVADVVGYDIGYDVVGHKHISGALRIFPLFFPNFFPIPCKFLGKRGSFSHFFPVFFPIFSQSLPFFPIFAPHVSEDFSETTAFQFVNTLLSTCFGPMFRG